MIFPSSIHWLRTYAGRPDADGREPAVRLRRRRHGAVLDPRHPIFRAVLHPAAAADRADPPLGHDADHLRAVRDRVLFAVVAIVRRLHHARIRHADLYHAPLWLSGSALRSRHVLGDILDKNLRRGLVLSDGELLPFFTRPLSAHSRLAGALHVRHQCEDHQRCHGAGAQCADRTIAPAISQVELTACAFPSATKSSPTCRSSGNARLHATWAMTASRSRRSR